MTALSADQSERATRAGATRRELLPLLLTGAVLALVLGLSFTRTFALWQQPTIIASTRPLAAVLGYDRVGAVQFAAPVLGAFAVYAVAVRLAIVRSNRRTRLLVPVFAVLLSLTMLPLNPAGAHDIYHNIADSRTLWHYGDNPLSVPPIAFPFDPIAPQVPAWQSTPSVYGPLWYLLSGIPLIAAGDDLWANVLGQKLLTAAFLLATTLLAIRVAERLRPGTGAAAGVIVGWNPLLQFETAGNAHNDIVMLCFTVAAIDALSRRRWRAVFPLLALAIAAKYIVALIGPLILIWMLRRRDIPRRDVLISLAGGAIVGLVVFLPFLRNGAVLLALVREAGFAAASPTAVVHTVLVTTLPLDGNQALSLIKFLVLPPLAVAYLRMLRRLPPDAGVAALSSGRSPPSSGSSPSASPGSAPGTRRSCCRSARCCPTGARRRSPCSSPRRRCSSISRSAGCPTRTPSASTPSPPPSPSARPSSSSAGRAERSRRYRDSRGPGP